MYSLKQSIQDPEKFVIDLTFNEPVPIVTDENGVDTPNIKQAEEELLLLGWDADGAKEMAHAFDTSCIQISADGQRISPLTDEDLMKYQERALHMVDNMNRIELADGVNMNGLAKVQEMFADLVGLRVTLDVIKKTEGFDYDRFFQALTKKFFRSYQSKDDAMARMNNGAHPPYYTRINYTFGQYDEFYQTYPTIVEGTPMYYHIADRETIW